MLSLIKSKSDTSYSETPQQKNLRFSFANLDVKNNTVIEVFPPVRCRDFLGDCLYSEETKKYICIYGFRFDPQINKLDKDKTRFILEFPNLETLNLFLINNLLLNSIEEQNNIQKTTFSRIEDTILLSEGDPFWMKAIFLISLYSFLFKVMCYNYINKDNWIETVSKQATNEGGYIRSVGPDRLAFFLQNLRSIIDPYFGVTGYESKIDVCVTYCHHNCGFVATLKNHTEKPMVNKYAQKAMEIYK